MAALRERDLDGSRTARVVGGGATATSIAYALAVLGAIDIQIVVRDVARADHAARVAREAGAHVTVQSMEEPLVEKVDLLVSTVPGDALASRGTELVQSARSVFDVAYDPWPSPLVAAAEATGLPTVNGLDLLAHQAALQVELMTGSTVDVDVLRTAARSALTGR
jgi:shikimate dehydrogenase